MTRKVLTLRFLQFLILSFLLLLQVIFFPSCHSGSEAESTPNIVLIVSDDQGWGDLGINGNETIHTPNIDKLAEGGIQFSRFYVSPVCSPTRAEILTGRYHPRGGVYSTSQGGERLDLDETTIADIFQSNGYHTAAFGKWHNGSQPPYHPNNRGFDEFYGFGSGHWGNYFSPMLEKNGEVVNGDGFIVDDFTNNALSYLESKKDQPFFVLLAYNTPHSPMQVPDAWWDKYKDAAIDSTHRYSHEEHVEKTKAAYALCENIDWNVGRVLDKLESLKLLENTIIIYMSDNGPNGWRWNDGLKGIKGSTDEGGVRSPFIMYWKNRLPPKIIDKIAGAIDILPTLTDLANIQSSLENPLDGVSLKPLLFGLNDPWENRYIFSHWSNQVSVRNQQFLLDADDQLFDLHNDSGQHSPINEPLDSVRREIADAKKEWINTVLTELDRNRKELFPVGYKESRFTQLPARDGVPHGNIQRSNRWPNASYFTNWLADTDSITWDCDILTKGNYKATVYYTCKASAIGSSLLLTQGENEVKTVITQAHDPALEGEEFDRFPREESYMKDFNPLKLGVIQLDEGQHSITLKASEIKGSQFIDFRLLVLEKLN